MVPLFVFTKTALGDGYSFLVYDDSADIYSLFCCLKSSSQKTEVTKYWKPSMTN